MEIPVVGEREVKDIADWAVPNEADYIALSFVQSAGDVKECRKHFGGKDIKAGVRRQDTLACDVYVEIVLL